MTTYIFLVFLFAVSKQLFIQIQMFFFPKLCWICAKENYQQYEKRVPMKEV